MISIARDCIASIVLSAVLAVAPVYAQGNLAGSAEQASAHLQSGIELEQGRQWIEAIQHYEAGVKEFPSDSRLRRRLLISRLHYDVIRRSSDSSIASIMRNASDADVLELYSEVLARLEMSYVDRIQMSDVVRGGTAYLEVALTEPGFISEHLPQRSADEIERFRTSIHRLTLATPARNRFEARSIVSRAAEAAQASVGLPPATTIMQFVFGAVGLLDPYSSFLSASELDDVESQIEGNFVGLGIALKPHQVPLQILNVIPGGPALEAGLQERDQICR